MHEAEMKSAPFYPYSMGWTEAPGYTKADHGRYSRYNSEPTGVHHSKDCHPSSPSTYPQPSQNTLPGSLVLTYRRLLRQRGQGSS
jgi:hypothetical protein